MFQDLLNLFYPRQCYVCEKPLLNAEAVLCISCRHSLPTTENHLQQENSTKKIFYGRVDLEHATSLLLFSKGGPVQKLIHELKYRGKEEIGGYLGNWLGSNLKEMTNYQQITHVVPVPLHKKKLKTRGYNQVAAFGKAIAKQLDATYVEDVLTKKSLSDSQAFKNRFSRWGKIEETFAVQNPEKLVGAHVLLVDDLVTTGATIEACANKLKGIKEIKLSLATMAIAD